MNILVTGAAGFIGFHLVKRLIAKGHIIVGLDNINDYYDVNLKYARLAELGVGREEASHWNEIVISEKNPAFSFIRSSIENKNELNAIFEEFQFDIVVNLAAQAGVRYSIQNPDIYIQSNIVGFHNILECCRNFSLKHLIYASSSSVYGDSDQEIFSVQDRVDRPVSLYAATKKSNELMAYTYSHLYGIPTTGLRFFTVYGPWGRPDMAIFLFTKAISEGMSIKVFNNGDLSRDFTYIDDIIGGVEIVLDNCPSTKIPYDVFNIGKGSPQLLKDFISEIELALGREAEKEYLGMQPGDVLRTAADISELRKIGYSPSVSISEGITSFVSWYMNYYLV